MKKVYLFLADGFEEVEAITVVDLLRRADIAITTVSTLDQKEVTSVHNIVVKADALFSECDFSDADMLVLPGGIPGTPNLEAHQGLSKLIDESARKGIKLAAICAAPSIYGKKGLLNGRRATAYPDYESNLLGAIVEDQPVVTDGNFITGRGMGTAIEFSLEILKQLGYEDQAKEMGSDIQFLQYYR